ncbi:MAG: hypothetical protein ACLUE8_06890 [Lachnospiraceae bacterium]
MNEGDEVLVSIIEHHSDLLPVADGMSREKAQ